MAVVLSRGELCRPLLQHLPGQHQLADDAVHDRPAHRHALHHVGRRPLELPLGGKDCNVFRDGFSMFRRRDY